MTIAEQVLSLLCEIFTPRASLPTWKWCEENVVLSRRVTQHPGPYRTDQMPYVRAPMDAFDDSKIRIIVLCFAARSSKTEMIFCMLRKNIAVDYESFIYAAPSESLARDWSETRFQPSLKDCPATCREIPENSDMFKLLSMHFKHCSGWFIGAGSPANLAGRGVCIVVMDEIDKWKEASTKETGAVQNLDERNRERWNRKTIKTSTPTVEGGQIWQEFLQGDQQYFFVPCPKCDQFQTLKKAQLKHDSSARLLDGTWDVEKVALTTFYECEFCEAKIDHSQKQAMLAKGEWRATAKTKEPGRVSYHLNALYSPWTTWAEVQNMFLKATAAGREELQKFINSWLAEPFYALGDPKDFFEALERVKRQEVVEGVPKDHCALMEIDVQQHSLFFEITAHDKQRNAQVLEFGQLPDFPEAEEIIKKWKPFGVFIDVGYAARQSEVLNWCYKMRKAGVLAVPVLGSAGLLTSFRWAKVPIEGGMFHGKIVESLRFRPNDFKDEWLRRVKRDQVPEENRAQIPKWLAPVHINDEWKRHHSSETPHSRKLGHGKTITEWILRNSRHPNHWFDNSIVGLMAFEAMRPIAFDVPQNPITTPSSPVVESQQHEALRELAEARGMSEPGIRNDPWN